MKLHFSSLALWLSLHRLSLSVFALLLVLAQCLPMHVHPFRSYYHELSGVLAVLVLIGFAELQSPFRFSLRSPLVLIVVLLSTLMLQVGLGLIAVADTYYLFMYGILAAACVVFGLTAARSRENAKQLCFALALAHLVAAVISVGMQQIQIAGWDARPIVMYMNIHAGVPIRPFANVAQPNQLALLICFGFASLWWLLQEKRLSGPWASLLALILIWGLVLTQSRIAWIILPAYAILLALGLVKRDRIHLLVLASLLFIYCVLMYLLPDVAQALGFKVASVADRVGGRSERSVLLQQAWNIALTHPWLGVGWSNFGKAQLDVAANFGSSIYAEHAHNIVLNFAAELGLPFTLLLGIAVAIWLWKICQAYASRMKNNEGQSNVMAFGLLMLLALAVHSMVEYPLWYAYVLLPISLVIGLLHGYAWPDSKERCSGLFKFFPTLFFVLGIVGSILVTLDYHRVVAGFQVLRSVPEPTSAPAAALAAPKFTLLPDFFDYFQIMRLQPKTNMSDEQIRFVERVSHRFAYIHLLDKLAQTYVLNDRIAQAKRTMISMQRLHPDAYPEYYDYWKILASGDSRYAKVFVAMPRRDAR
ncbi:PglL family O-oligosaccharyltransferase [Undibacterium fentianense]|uniref:O-antigen ligase C-terminal domain-containing protein n=1 Tax=Undibacterium fentianense TaxID=2828728 RepID=A0A941IDC0_9BURK|nr:O-antigen ligase family protein [Undibacterium fentianense]MBR7801154.1 O-antigen ligase C-terminal domain-containing protein [Undibacterium fentianense]